MTASEMKSIGTMLDGKYALLDPIGKGGMGTVYEAQHLGTDRRVAIKILHRELARKPVIRARFEREARAAARIDHDNVCEVLDSGVAANDVHYLVMPLLRGESLGSVLSRKGALPAERACDVVGQILDALAAAHEKGVIHRDLKPANIFLVSVGDRPDFVKILDFGVTKLDTGGARDDDDSLLTRTGTVVGTPYCMAPEQARAAKDIDHRVDLYAVGVMLYEMTTGRRPIEGDSHNEILWRLWNAPVKPPSAHQPDLDPALEAVVLRAMARNRDQRYSTAAELKLAIDQVQTTSPAAATTSSQATTDYWGDENVTDSIHVEDVAPVSRAAEAMTVDAGNTTTMAWLLEDRRRRRLGLAALSIAVVASAALALPELLHVEDDAIHPAGEGRSGDLQTVPPSKTVQILGASQASVAKTQPSAEHQVPRDGDLPSPPAEYEERATIDPETGSEPQQGPVSKRRPRPRVRTKRLGQRGRLPKGSETAVKSRAAGKRAFGPLESFGEVP